MSKRISLLNYEDANGIANDSKSNQVYSLLENNPQYEINELDKDITDYQDKVTVVRKAKRDAAVLESTANIISKGEIKQKAAIEALSILTTHIAKRNGYLINKSNLSTESFLEGVSKVTRSIIEAIKKTIAKIVQWFKDVFSRLFSASDKIEKRQEKIETKIKESKKDFPEAYKPNAQPPEKTEEANTEKASYKPIKDKLDKLNGLIDFRFNPESINLKLDIFGGQEIPKSSYFWKGGLIEVIPLEVVQTLAEEMKISASSVGTDANKLTGVDSFSKTIDRVLAKQKKWLVDQSYPERLTNIYFESVEIKQNGDFYLGSDSELFSRATARIEYFRGDQLIELSKHVSEKFEQIQKTKKYFEEAKESSHLLAVKMEKVHDINDFIGSKTYKHKEEGGEALTDEEKETDKQLAQYFDNVYFYNRTITKFGSIIANGLKAVSAYQGMIESSLQKIELDYK